MCGVGAFAFGGLWRVSCCLESLFLLIHWLENEDCGLLASVLEGTVTCQVLAVGMRASGLKTSVERAHGLSPTGCRASDTYESPCLLRAFNSRRYCLATSSLGWLRLESILMA